MMYSRLNESTQSKKPSSALNKNQLVNKPASESVRKPTQVLGDVNSNGKRSVKIYSPSLSGKLRPSSGNLKTYPLRQPSTTTTTTTQKLVSKQRHLRIADIFEAEDSKANSKSIVSQEDIDQLTSKFQDLTEAIVRLATSKEPLDPQALEALLSREIANSLGPAVSNPKLSQCFIQATRALLDNLVCVYEEGRINPKLLSGWKTARPTFLRARSSTTVCYRDQYLKELIMNVLHSMCSNQVEEEVSRASSQCHNLSAASKQRIHAIRDIVRAEAGIEPEAFHQMERQLEELRRSHSKKKLEMLEAASEVERAISEQLAGSNSLASFQIPDTAREAIKRGRAETQSDCGDERTGESLSRVCLENPSVGQCTKIFSKTSISSAKSSLQNIQRYMDIAKNAIDSATELQNRIACQDSDSSSVETTEDLFALIRPEIQKMVQDELLKAKEKLKVVLNSAGRFEESVRNTRSSSECSQFTVRNDREEDGEINTEETEIVLEALKADLPQNNNGVAVNSLDGFIGLDRIDEADGELSALETSLNEIPKFNKDRQANKANNTSNDFQNSKVTLKNVVLEPDILPGSITLTKSPNNVRHADVKTYRNNEEGLSTIHLQDTNVIPTERKRSKWWSEDELLAREIVQELKEAFKIVEPSNTPIVVVRETCGSRDTKETKTSLNDDFDFTVEEIADILKEISLKVVEFPSLLQRTEPHEKEEIFQILSEIEHSLNGSNPSDDDLKGITKSKPFILSVDSVSKTFSFLSERLQLAPRQLRKQPISMLDPPKTLINTLAFLASTHHFKGCFMSAVLHGNLDRIKLERRISKRVSNDLIVRSSNAGKEIEQIHFNLAEQMSSESTQPLIENTQPSTKTSDTLVSKANVRRMFNTGVNKDEEIQKHLASFEHYLGLGLSVLTIQNISDIFLYLSTVLNDVPDRIKSKKLISLNPPTTLIKSLDILYAAESVERTDDEKRKSFASLTVQNASDFFLTLSKALQDTPPRMKNTPVLELDPPQSLLKAVSILTCLSQSSVIESWSQEEVAPENVADEAKEDGQETFFDALESLRED